VAGAGVSETDAGSGDHPGTSATPRRALRPATAGLVHFSHQRIHASMSLGLILVIILIIFLLGGFSGRFGGYGYGFGHGGVGLLGVLLIIVVVLMLAGRI
jgi:hypothetical protein